MSWHMVLGQSYIKTMQIIWKAGYNLNLINQQEENANIF